MPIYGLGQFPNLAVTVSVFPAFELTAKAIGFNHPKIFYGRGHPKNPLPFISERDPAISKIYIAG
jgi:hypothetical protein